MATSSEKRPALSLFGGPELMSPDGVVVGLTRTQEALLTLVWGHDDRGVTRQQVIRLLWEDDDGPRSRHRLSQVLHEIRGRVGIDPIDISGEDTLLPAWDAVRSDVGEVREALRTGALQRAMAIQGHGFATRLRRVPGEQFEDWLTAKRVGLRREMREAAARIWDENHVRSQWRAVREAAEVLHALDRDSEGALRKVIEARAMTERFEAAEAAFAAYVDAHGGLDEVSAETRTLMDRIRTLRVDEEQGPPRDSEPLPPLVGRLTHLETARGAIDRVRREGFEFVLLHGESGLGKTRLWEELRRECHIKGFRCLQSRAVELEYRIPLNPLIDALGHPEAGAFLKEMEDPWRSVIAALLPTLPPGVERTEVPAIAESSLTRRLFDAFHMLFEKIAEDAPTLLFIDDLQWADATTVATLQFMQRRWRSGAFAVVATMRSDLSGEHEDTRRYFTDDTDDLEVTRVSVEELSDQDAKELVRHVAGAAVNEGTIERLTALGGRNPFYLIELTRDYVAGKVQLPAIPSDALLVPISLRQLVEPRIERVSEGAKVLLNYLAILGRWTPLEELMLLSHHPEENLVNDVEELERHRLILADRNRIRITHELIRGSVYHGLSKVRRAVLHRTVANGLLKLGKPQPGELAMHFDRAGERRAACTYGRLAANMAMENGAMAEASFFLDVVVENEDDETERALATGDLARVLHMKRDIQRANPLLELAARRLRAVGQFSIALRMDIRRIEALAELGAEDPTTLMKKLTDARRAARERSDDEAWALTLDLELHILDRVGAMTALDALFSEIRLCAKSEDPSAACLANAALAIDVLFRKGKEPLDAARKAVQLAEKHGLTEHLFLAQMRLYIALYSRGLSQSQEASDLLIGARDLATTSGDVGLKFQLFANVGVAEMDAGNLDAAAIYFAQADDVLGAADDSIARFHLQCNLGELSVMRSDYHAALEHYTNADEMLEKDTGTATIAPIIAAGVGLSALETGDLAQARHSEARLGALPREWRFDPYMLLVFRARMLERKRQPRAAVTLLSEHVSQLRERLPNTCLKLLLAEAQTARRTRIGDWRVAAAEAAALAKRLNFPAWEAEANRLVGLP